MKNLDQYKAELNPWFNKTVEYIGDGTAEFSSPAGWIKGKTHISVNDVGIISVKMLIEECQINNPLETTSPHNDNLRWLLSGRKPHQAGMYAFHIDPLKPQQNTCVITVTTPNGVFKSLNTTYAKLNLNNSNEIEFNIRQAEFIANDSSKPKYWVMPLSNFVHSSLLEIPFLAQRHILDSHPLRVRKIARIPNNLSVKDLQKAIIYANQSNCFIPFKFKGHLGFIESLEHYHEAKNDLESKSTQIATTALMVGECDGDPITFSEIFNWFPLDYLQALSLASGTFVGCPWIEIRNENGDLIKRIHTRQWQISYLEGHKAIRSCNGISQIISNMTLKLNSQLRMALRFAVKAGTKHYNLNDKMLFLFIAFETLTQYYRKSGLIDNLQEPQKSLAASLLRDYEQAKAVTYDDEMKQNIQNLLQNSANQIYELGKSFIENAQSISDESQRTYHEQIGDDLINRVSQRVKQALHNRRTQPNISEAILLLLKELGFHDPDLIDNRMPEWTHIASMYRNQLVHEGFFKTSTNEHKVAEFTHLYSHLMDILIRIILRKLNYPGKYIPAVPLGTEVDLDWVQPDSEETFFNYL